MNFTHRLKSDTQFLIMTPIQMEFSLGLNGPSNHRVVEPSNHRVVEFDLPKISQNMRKMLRIP